MEWVLMALCVLLFILGVLLGAGHHNQKAIGTLRIDNSDPEDGPYMFLELKADPRLIMNKKQVVLNVNTESYLTHE